MNNKKKASMLDACMQSILNGDISLQDGLEQYPHLAHELNTMVKISSMLESTGDAEKRSHELQTIRSRMLGKLPSRAHGVTNPFDFRYIWQTTKRRFAMSWIIIITTLLSLVTGAGTVYASGSSLPGDVLYPVKNWSEDFRLRLAADEDKEFALQMQFMDMRMQELGELIDRGRTGDLDNLQLRYQNQTQALTQAINLIESKNPESATQLQEQLQEKLREQERLMIHYLDNEGSKEDALQLRLRTMLQTNTQARERLQTRTQEQLAQQPDEAPLQEKRQEQNRAQDQSEKQQVQHQNQPVQTPPGQFFKEGGLKYKFTFQAGMEDGVYARINGQRYACSRQGDEMVCDLAGAPQSGKIEIINSLTHQYLFSYEYAYNWQGEKENQPDPYQYQKEYTYGEGSGSSSGSSDSGGSGGSNGSGGSGHSNESGESGQGGKN